MAFYLISRHANKFRAVNKLIATQMSTISRVESPPKMLLAANKIMKCEQPLTKSFSVTAPKLSAANHSNIWKVERVLSAALLGLLPTAIAFPSQGLDILLATCAIAHSHLGLEAIVVDYVRPVLFGPVVPKIAHGALILLSVATLGGLYYFIYNDIGIGKSVRKIWSVKGQ